MFKTEIIINVKNYVTELYRKNETELICYHCFAHAKEVVEVIDKMSEAMNIPDDEKENLIIAGWFHDVGYFEKGCGHEEVSTEYAVNYLSGLGYPLNQIEKVKKYIMATKVPTNPENIYEQIICDADLHHLGMNDIEHKSELFKLELEKKDICHPSNIEWIESNIKFLKEHSFYTDYAKNEFGIQKEINLRYFEMKLEKMKNEKEKK